MFYWDSVIHNSTIRDHSFRTFEKLSEKTNISYPLIRIHTCAYQEVRNVSFLENFGNVLNEWSLRKLFWAISQCVPIVSFWNDWSKATYSYEVLSAIWYHLYNFKNEKNTQGFFSHFLNWKNGSKSCKAFHMFSSFLKQCEVISYEWWGILENTTSSKSENS